MSLPAEWKPCHPEKVKVVMVGEAGVGKTSIAKRFVEDTFSSNYTSTIGVSSVSKEVVYDKLNGTRLKMEIWDTAGQEVYKSLSKLFYREANIGIIIYDVTRESSFQEIEYWYDDLKKNSSNDISKLIFNLF